MRGRRRDVVLGLQRERVAVRGRGAPSSRDPEVATVEWPRVEVDMPTAAACHERTNGCVEFVGVPLPVGRHAARVVEPDLVRWRLGWIATDLDAAVLVR